MDIAQVQRRRSESLESASAFEERRTGHVPQSVTVVLSEDTLVITLHGDLSPAREGPR